MTKYELGDAETKNNLVNAYGTEEDLMGVNKNDEIIANLV